MTHIIQRTTIRVMAVFTLKNREVGRQRNSVSEELNELSVCPSRDSILQEFWQNVA